MSALVRYAGFDPDEIPFRYSTELNKLYGDRRPCRLKAAKTAAPPRPAPLVVPPYAPTWGPRPELERDLPKVAPALILVEAGRRYGIGEVAVYGAAQTKIVCLARDEASWRLRYETGLTLERIGKILRRHHASIIYAIRRHQARIAAEYRR